MPVHLCSVLAPLHYDKCDRESDGGAVILEGETTNIIGGKYCYIMLDDKLDNIILGLPVITE